MADRRGVLGWFQTIDNPVVQRSKPGSRRGTAWKARRKQAQRSRRRNRPVKRSRSNRAARLGRGMYR